MDTRQAKVHTDDNSLKYIQRILSEMEETYIGSKYFRNKGRAKTFQKRCLEKDNVLVF